MRHHSGVTGTEETGRGTPLKGRLMVATPLLDDPNFHRTVVLVVEHGEYGALGLVVNRASSIDVDAPLSPWRGLVSPPVVLFAGGPLRQEAVIALARITGSSPAGAFQAIGGGIGVLDLTVDADTVRGAIGDLRIFTGYAGWGGGQLEAEIAHGGWFVVDAEPRDAFASGPDELWRDVLRRQPPPLRRYALYPADPSMN